MIQAEEEFHGESKMKEWCLSHPYLTFILALFLMTTISGMFQSKNSDKST